MLPTSCSTLCSCDGLLHSCLAPSQLQRHAPQLAHVKLHQAWQLWKHYGGGCTSKLTVLGHMQQCEDLEDGESLRHLYHIIRGAIMLNDANLLDLLLAEGNVMDMVSTHSLPSIPCSGLGP